MFNCFLFWTIFRTALAVLAHFNWLAAFKAKKELKDRAWRRSTRKQRREKVQKAIQSGSKKKMEEVSSDSSTDEEVEELMKNMGKKVGWKAANIRQVIQTKYKDLRSKAEEALLPAKAEGEDAEAGGSKTGKWDLVKGIVEKVTSPKPQRKIERTIDIEEDFVPITYPLYPNYSNIFDVNDEKKARKRERKDVRLLRKRVRDRVIKELEEKAEEERRRKLLTDAIDLLLNMLRMVTMFALVTWNIRKHNPVASFKHLEIDFDPDFGDQEIRDLQMGYVPPEWVLALSVTVFLDVFMSFLQFIIAYYQQIQLLKRMGFWWSFLWTSILVIVSLFGMVMPMLYIMGSLDVSWCRILPNAELACWMPPHWVDFPLEDRRIECNWWMALEGGGHRSPDGYSDFVDHSQQRRFLRF